MPDRDQRRGVWGGELWAGVDDSLRALLEKGGGSWSLDEAAKVLRVGPDEVVQLVREGKLLGIRTDSGELRLPRAQFDEGGALTGVDRVLGVIEVRDEWSRLGVLMDDSVLIPLREGRVAEAAEAARRIRPG